MTQVQSAWGAAPSPQYEALAARFRPVFERIRAGAVERDLQRRLPHEELHWLREAGFTKLRLPQELGGLGATLPELFGLLIELGAADSNVVNAVRAHQGFTEDVLNAADPAWRQRWLARVAAGDFVGSGFSEAGDAKVGSFSTRLRQTPEGLRLDGEKFYTTGSLFGDWINTAAANDRDESILVLVPRRAAGVEVLDDWDGFGQALTGSGTARFSAVAIEPEWVNPSLERFSYSTGYYQLVHLATLAGIGRALADDVAQRVKERQRIYSHGNASRVSDDPQILQVVGRVRSAAYGAGAIVLQAAAALQRVYDATGAEAKAQATVLANVEVDQSVSVVTQLVLDASTELFDALGASAARRTEGLDRYWRNARTICSHNPRVYRERAVGSYAVKGEAPPAFYRIGAA